MNRVIMVGIASLASLLFAVSAQATATINGTLYDQDGTQVMQPDCTIEIEEYADTPEYTDTTTTSSSGTFTFEVPDAGRYDISMLGSDCEAVEEADQSAYETSVWVTDNTTTETPMFVGFSDRVVTVRGRVLSPSGAPLGDKELLVTSRDYLTAEETSTAARTNSTGRFNINLPPGAYDLSFDPSFDCADQANPLQGIDVCLALLKRNITFEAGTLTDLGDLQFQVGQNTAAILSFMEETSPSVFNPISADSFILTSYQADDSGGLQLGTITTSLSGGGSIFGPADPDLDWVFDVVAKVGRKVYHGSMLVEAADLGATVTWLSLDTYGYSYPAVDFVLTEKFDLDDPNLSTLDQTFDSGVENVLTMSNGIEITVPANAFGEEVSDVRMVAEPAFDIKDSYFPVDGLSYNMTVYNESTNAVIGSFARPITIEMPYTETDLVLADVDEADIQPWYYDEDMNIWKSIPGPLYEHDSTANTLTFSVSHFSQYGITFDRIGDMKNKATAHNDVAKLRVPGKLKALKSEKKYRQYKNITKKGKMNGRISITMKRPRMDISGYEVRFSTKKGKKKKVGIHKKNSVWQIKERYIKKGGKANRDRVNIKANFPLDKTFYVRVRPYLVHGVTKFGKWSKPKKVRINRADTGL